MSILPLLLLVLALVFFALATANAPSSPRFSWFPAGALCLVIWLLVGAGVRI